MTYVSGEFSHYMKTCHLSSYNSINHYSDPRNIDSWSDLRLRQGSVHTCSYDSTFIWISGSPWDSNPLQGSSLVWDSNTLWVSFTICDSNPLRCPPIPHGSTIVGTQTHLRHKSLVPHPHFLLYISISNGMCTIKGKYLNTWLDSTYNVIEFVNMSSLITLFVPTDN